MLVSSLHSELHVQHKNIIFSIYRTFTQLVFVLSINKTPEGRGGGSVIKSSVVLREELSFVPNTHPRLQNLL